jgi:hypothetical protein
MGQTPPTDLKLRPIITAAAEGWALVRVEPGSPIAETIVTAPFVTWTDAVIGWRIAGHYVRPVPSGIEAWTMTHVDGWCGGDEAGCPHCQHIARQYGPTAETHNVLANRRNLPLGIGQGVWRDELASERAARL